MPSFPARLQNAVRSRRRDHHAGHDQHNRRNRDAAEHPRTGVLRIPYPHRIQTFDGAHGGECDGALDKGAHQKQPERHPQDSSRHRHSRNQKFRESETRAREHAQHAAGENRPGSPAGGRLGIDTPARPGAAQQTVRQVSCQNTRHSHVDDVGPQHHDSAVLKNERLQDDDRGHHDRSRRRTERDRE